MTITVPDFDITTLAPNPATTRQDASYDFRLVAFDVYRDIHKGIRSELFAITSTAGSVDPSDRCGRLALADHVAAVGGVLESHAEHEDGIIEPALAEHLPELADQVHTDHQVLEARFAFLTQLAQDAADAARADQRRLGHLLYLELSGFTSAYLAHQLVEERVVMPGLERAVGIDAVVGMHVAIVSSIPPDEMARSLAFMLPAMNLDDRTEMLAGIRASAPPEAFAGVVDLARSVLDPTDHAALARRLQVG